MKKYTVLIAGHRAEAHDILRDLQVIYKDNQPVEIQAWVGSRVHLDGTELRSEAPICHRIPVTDDLLFGPTGLHLKDALVLLGVIASAAAPAPVNAADVVTPECPLTIGAKVEALQLDKAAIEGEISLLHGKVQSAERDLAHLTQQLQVEADRLQQDRAKHDEEATVLEQHRLAAIEQLDEINHQITAKTRLLAGLDDAIKAKSERSTEASHQLDQVLTAIGLAEKAERLPEFIRAQQRELDQLEARYHQRAEELNGKLRLKQLEYDQLDQKIREAVAEAVQRAERVTPTSGAKIVK